jgi:hypothetical protein
MNYTKGIIALEQLEKRCNSDLIKDMKFKSNVIGYEWIEVKLNDNTTYDINLIEPNKYKLKLEKLEEYNEKCMNAKLCLFIADIIKYKRNVIINYVNNN